MIHAASSALPFLLFIQMLVLGAACPSFDCSKVNVVEGDNAKLPCKVQVLRNSTIVWRDKSGTLLSKNNKSLQDDPRLSTVRDFGSWSLQIASVRASDEGMYECVANYMAQRHFVQVHVKVPPRIILTHPTSFEMVEGSSLNLTCRVTGSPPPTVTWYKKVKADGPELDTHVHGEVFWIPKLKATCGLCVFSCQADNGSPRKPRMSFQVHLQFTPSIISNAGYLSIVEGQKAVMVCEVISRPDAGVYWINPHGQQVINDSVKKIWVEQKRLNRTTVSVRVIIDQVRKGDFGLYTCYAVNKLGTATMGIKLTKAVSSQSCAPFCGSKGGENDHTTGTASTLHSFFGIRILWTTITVINMLR